MCPYGNITEIPAYGIGVNDETLKIRDACVVNQTKFKNEECSSDLNLPSIFEYFNKTCVGKPHCTLNIKDPNYDFWYQTKQGARPSSCQN